MFIEQITLKNIKSYDSTPTVINFKEGVNLIAGTNGAGKSTILEAIGFTLFDALPYSQKDFKRRGGSGSSQITVRLHSDYDGRSYDIERSIPANFSVTDENNISPQIESKNEFYQWICQHLKVESHDNLKPLFENAIGVQQGTITAVFLTNKAGREATFNALLGIQDYKTAHSNLNDTRRYIADLIIKNGNDIARLEGQTESLPQKQQEYKDIQDELVDKQEEFEHNAETVKTLDTEVTRLTQQKETVDHLQQQLNQIKERIKQQTTTVETAQQNFEQAQQAQEIISNTQEAYTRYQEAFSLLEELEEKREERDQFDKQKQDIKTQLASDQQKLENVKKQLDDVADAEAKLEELQPLVAQQDELDSKLATAKDDQKRRDQLNEQLKTNDEKAQNLAFELESMRKDFAQRQQLDTQVTEHQSERDDLKNQLETLDEQRHALQAEVDNAQEVLDTVTDQYQSYQQKQSELASQKETLNEQQSRRDAIEANVNERTDLESQRDGLSDQINQAENDNSLANNTIQRVITTLEELQTARSMLSADDAVCPVCRREMDGQAHQEAIDYYDTQEKQLLSEQTQAEQKLTDNKKSLKTWKKERTKIEKEIDKLDNQVALDKIDEDIKATEVEIVTLTSELEAMHDIPQAYESAEQAHKQAQKALAEHDDKVNGIKTRRESLTEQIADLNEQIADLPSQKQLNDKTDDYDSLITTIESDQAQLETLSDIDTIVSDLESELAELDNPRRQYDVADNTASQRDKLETEQADIQQAINDKQAQLAHVEADLAQYATLADDLSQVRQMRDDNAEGHQQYLEHKQVAEQFADREQALKQAGQALANTQDQHQTLQTEFDNAQQDFDEEHYVGQQQTLQNLKDSQIELNTEINSQIKQRDTLKAEIDDLNKVVADIKRLGVTGKQLREQEDAFSFIRSGIRDAGPRIRQKKVEFVSQVASNYFSEIINDYTMRLYWNWKDYGIEVEQSGETRPFSVLSGGEQMIAALSVRLALLTHMTHARLIFLDEPTINLDENRRIQLAERLSQIKGLNQLFVISHDDTFISDSNHVITVTKDGDVSKVETSHATIY